MANTNSLNIDEAGIQTYSTTTGNLTGSATTQYNVLVGDASNKLTNVAPSATSGVPLISSGSSANPAFGTVVVAGGGTGNTTFTAYSVVCAGTTATGAFQNVSGTGTAGQGLTSNGAGALPTWQNLAGTTQFAMAFSTTSGNPADSTTYYLSEGSAATTASTSADLSNTYYVPFNGTITKVYGSISSSLVGTSENCTIAVRINDTTNTNVTTTLQMNVSPRAFSNTGLSISVSKGDTVNLLFITPAWATNPTLSTLGAIIYLSS